MTKIIFHIDANYFFARCEEILDPKLTLVPFVVSGNNKRSVVSSANLLARSMGIKAADKISEFIDQKKIKIIEPKFNYYSQKSKELFKAIEDFLSIPIEVASIDECYVDVSQLVINSHNEYKILASELKEYIFKETKIIVSIGIGENKFLAKMANEIKTKNNINVILKKDISKKIWPLNIEKVYMVGKKTAEILNSLNIKKVIDFINYRNQNELIKMLDSKYWLIKNYCHGVDDSLINPFHSKQKSISSGKTLITNTANQITLIGELRKLCNELIEEINKLKISISTINLMVKFSYTEHKSKTKTLEMYTNDGDLIFAESKKLFFMLWDDQEIRGMTLTFTNFKDNNEISFQTKIKWD